MRATAFFAATLALAPSLRADTTATECRADVESTVRVLILDLATDDTPAALTKTMAQIVAREAARVPGFVVLTNDELRTVLDREAEKQLFGCDDSSCLAEFAGALDADLLVSGQVDRSLDGATTVSLNLLNTRAIVTMNRVSLTWAGDAARLPELAAAAAMLLLVEKARRPSGAIAIDGAPDGARIFVDDRDVSETLEEGIVRGLDVGTHAVRVEADGYEPLETTVLLSSSEPARVDGTLVERSLFSSGWLWGGLGAAAVLSAIVTAGVVVWATDASVSASSSIAGPTLSGVESVKGR